VSKKKKTPTLGALKKKAWKLVSEWVRRSHADEGGTVSCVTCGKLMHWKESHAGHAIPGRHGAVLFDTEIIRPQCPIDNVWKGGRYEIFAAKLIREHGLEWYEAKLAGAQQVVKIGRADYEELIRTYKQKLEALC
jgi:hypothetical protein